MGFISRNSFFVEDKGSHSAKVQVLPVPLFWLFQSAQMPELGCSTAAGVTGTVGSRAVTPRNITEQEAPTELGSFIVLAGSPVCPAIFRSCLK